MSNKMSKQKREARYQYAREVGRVITRQREEAEEEQERRNAFIRQRELERKRKQEEAAKAREDWRKATEELGTIPAVGATCILRNCFANKIAPSEKFVRIVRNTCMDTPPGWMINPGSVGLVAFIQWPPGKQPFYFSKVKVVKHNFAGKSIVVEPFLST